MKKSLDKIIKKSLKNIENRYKHTSPNIISSFYYGDYNQNPNLLSIIYIFNKKIDMEEAQNTNLTDELEYATKNELISNGYPKFAFASKNDFDITNDEVSEDSLILFKEFVDKMNKQCVSILFVSNEDIKNKADGNIFLYLK